MLKSLRSGLKLSFVLLSLSFVIGCQSVQTTDAGAVDVKRKQFMLSSISTEEINNSYANMYQETLMNARDEKKLDTKSKNAQRLQVIGKDLIAQVGHFREDALNWDWEINLIDSPEINANCGPGGKIIFYTGIIETLNLTDAEIAAVMGHEIAHALREHGREQVSRAYTLGAAKTGLGVVLGLGNAGMTALDAAVSYGLMLPNSRGAETEADLIGIELAARAGYDPNGAVSLWQKMDEASGGNAPPQFTSTHPSSKNRIKELQAAMPKVMPYYQQAKK